MGKSLFAFPNFVDADYWPTVEAQPYVYGGQWRDMDVGQTFHSSLNNLLDPRLSRVARSLDDSAPATQFKVDLIAARDVRVIALLGGNFSKTAEYRIRGGNDSTFATSLYDSGWQFAHGAVYPPGTLGSLDPAAADGKVRDEDLPRSPMPIVKVLPAPGISARHWYFEFRALSGKLAYQDPNGSPYPYLELSRLYMARAWQPTINMAPGVNLGWQTETRRERADGGAAQYDPRPRYREFRCVIKVPMDETLAWPHEMQQRLGVHRQLFFVYDDADTYHMHRRSMLCTLRELTPIEYPFFNHGQTAIALTEVL